VPVAALLVGRSQHGDLVGRRRVGSLLIARVVQGLATGIAAGALAAGLVEFAPEERPHLRPTMTAVGTSVGMAIGAGAVGLLLQVTTHPDANAFPLLTLAFVSLAVVVLAIPEPHTRRAGELVSLRARVCVPLDPAASRWFHRARWRRRDSLMPGFAGRPAPSPERPPAF
jgi:MFS family permease